MTQVSVVKKFGAKVRMLRKEKGWSQQELADKAGLHKNYIGMLERGERNPSLFNLEIIARALDISLTKLFDF